MSARPRPAVLDTILRRAVYLFFYGYTLLLILGGAWGVLFAPLDFDLLIGMQLPGSEDQARANVLSQYRFLRGLEFGVGAVVLSFRREVFSVTAVNRGFLVVLGAGIAGRAVSLPLDGSPSPAFYFFLLSELAGMIVILVYRRRFGLVYPTWRSAPRGGAGADLP